MSVDLSAKLGRAESAKPKADALRAFTQLAKELHRGIRQTFPRRKVYSPAPNWIWSCDLVDYSKIKKENDGYAYILICCDVFSKYVLAVPLLDKSAKSVVKAFETFDTLPKFVWTDKGKEFYNNLFEAYCKENKMSLYSTYSESKSVIAERFNRTLKGWIQLYMTINSTLRWVDELDTMIKQYNDRVHSTIKVKPKDALLKENFNKVYEILYKDYEPTSLELPKNALRIGNYVRVSRLKGVFEKGYDTTWSEEVFKVRSVKMTSPVTYEIEDWNNNPIEGSFYRYELLKIKLDPSAFFRVEKVIKEDKKNKRAFVKFMGWHKKFNAWVSLDELRST